MAQFLHFLAEPTQDFEWSRATGYVPITHAGYDLAKQQGFFDQNPGTELPVRQLTRGEVTDNSRGFHLGRMPEIRTIIEEECEQALAGKQGAKQALDTAVNAATRCCAISRSRCTPSALRHWIFPASSAGGKSCLLWASATNKLTMCSPRVCISTTHDT